MSSATSSKCAVIVCGPTGSGKTSLIQMANQGAPTAAALRSDTSITAAHRLSNGVHLIDTPGFLDNRAEKDRAQLFQNMLNFINSGNYAVKKVFLCNSGSERLNPDVLTWFCDMAVATHAEATQLCIVLTKLDTKGAVERSANNISDIKQRVPGVQVITTGEERVGEFMSILGSINSLPTLTVASNFETSEKLMQLMQKQQREKEKAEQEYQLQRFQRMSELDQEISRGEHAITEWQEQIDEARRQNCPDRDLIDRSQRQIIDQQKQLLDLKTGKITIAQSKANTARFEKEMKRIEAEFMNRNRWLSFFQNLLPGGRHVQMLTSAVQS